MTEYCAWIMVQKVFPEPNNNNNIDLNNAFSIKAVLDSTTATTTIITR